MNLCQRPFVSSGTAHVQVYKKHKNSLNPINQALEYCTVILVEAATPHRPETSSLKAVYEYRALAQAQSKRPFQSPLTCLGLFLQRPVSHVGLCTRRTPRLHLPRALPHPRRE